MWAKHNFEYVDPLCYRLNVVLNVKCITVYNMLKIFLAG